MGRTFSLTSSTPAIVPCSTRLPHVSLAATPKFASFSSIFFFFGGILISTRSLSERKARLHKEKEKKLFFINIYAFKICLIHENLIWFRKCQGNFAKVCATNSANILIVFHILKTFAKILQISSKSNVKEAVSTTIIKCSRFGPILEVLILDRKIVNFDSILDPHKSLKGRKN